MPAAIASSVFPMPAHAMPDVSKTKGNGSFAEILGQQFSQVAQEGQRVEESLHVAAMGKGGFEKIAQDFAEFVAKVEAIKNLADAGISAAKQIMNTPL